MLLSSIYFQMIQKKNRLMMEMGQNVNNSSGKSVFRNTLEVILFKIIVKQNKKLYGGRKLQPQMNQRPTAVVQGRY